MKYLLIIKLNLGIFPNELMFLQIFCGDSKIEKKHKKSNISGKYPFIYVTVVFDF